MSAGGDVRQAGVEQRRDIALMLALAFQNDPAMCFIFPDAGIRQLRLPRLFELLFESDRAQGMCLVTPAGEAATLWRKPGRAHTPWWEMVAEAPALLRALGPALGRALAFSRVSDAEHPAEPHWYLHVAGCAPQAQGRGHGRAVIRAGLDRAEHDRVPTYLETASERNVGYYQSLGFAVTGSWRVRGRLQMWSMLRQAGANRAGLPPA